MIAKKYLPKLEHANGESFNLTGWLRDALKHQDIAAWQRDCGQNWKQELAQWVKESLLTTVQNLDVVIQNPEVNSNQTKG